MPFRIQVPGFTVFFSYLYILPAVIMFVAFVAYPILWVVVESFYGQKRNSWLRTGWL